MNEECVATYGDSILLIARQMRNAPKDEPKITNERSHEPFRIDENFDTSLFLNPTKERIVELLKRKYVAKLKTLKPFVDVMKYMTSSKGVSICPLSSNSKKWNLLYGSQRQVARVLQYAKEIGLLYCVSESYSNKLGYCKEYAYDKRVEKKLIELFNDYHISHNSKSYNKSYVISIIDKFKKDKEQWELYEEYMKKSKIRIVQQTRIALDEGHIIMGLSEMYPQYIEMLETIDEDNSSMELIDYDYAIPTFNWNTQDERIL